MLSATIRELGGAGFGKHSGDTVGYWVRKLVYKG